MAGNLPQLGDTVRVRRYRHTSLDISGVQPHEDRTGRVTCIRDLNGTGNPAYWLDGEEDHIAPGYTFLGGGPYAMYLVTTVEPAPPQQHQIKLRVVGGRAEVTVIGDTPLAPGRYRGVVIKTGEVA